MILPRMIFGTLILLCILGASVASATDETVYETYDCEYFTVEYPSYLDVEKGINIAYEGWDYDFGGTLSVTIGDDTNALTYVVPVNAIENGTMFSDDIMHFLDTLYIKHGETFSYSQAGTHMGYDTMFFDFEYDSDWRTQKPDINNILDVIKYGVYDYNSGKTTYAQVTVSEDDVVAFSLQTAKKGNIIRGPVKHIVDTLHFSI